MLCISKYFLNYESGFLYCCIGLMFTLLRSCYCGSIGLFSLVPFFCPWQITKIRYFMHLETLF